MAKISVSPITAGYNLSKINAAIQAIIAELNNNVLYRNNPAGEPNSMTNDLDMDSNDVLNVNNLDTQSLKLQGVQVQAGEKLYSLLSQDITHSPTSETIAEVLNRSEFNTAAIMQAVVDIPAGTTCRTQGRATEGDLGAATYLVKTAVDYGGTPDEYADLTLANGNIAVLQTEGYVIAPQCGVLPSSPTSPVDIGTALNALSIYAQTNKVEVVFPAGLYFSSVTWEAKRGVKYVGLNRLPQMRVGASDSETESIITGESGAIFVFTGTGSKTYQADFCSNGRHVGYDRAMTSATTPVYDQHPTATTPFTEFLLFDGTNEDASGATRATLRSFSAAIHVEESWDRIEFVNIKAIPSCPGVGETQGLGGYADFSTVRPWADWDFGIWSTNSWRIKMTGCDIAGYWREGAKMDFGPPDSAFTANTPIAEEGMYEDCTFQSGVLFRAGDLFPVIDKTSSTIYVRWSASHRFPSSGSIWVTDSDTYGGAVEYTYTSLTYTTSPTPNTGNTGSFLIFNGLSSTASISTTSDNLSKVVTIPGQGGHSHTKFSDCRFFDVSHTQAIDESSDDMAAYRDKYSCALELSGAPMRAIKFENCLINAVGPRSIHLGACRDVLFYGDVYGEAKAWRWNSGDALETDRGTTFIAGPSVRDDGDGVGMYDLEGDEACGARVMVIGHPLNSNMNMAPLVEPRASVRMSTMVDVFNAKRVFMPAYSNPVDNLDYNVYSLAGQEVRIYRKDSTYADSLVLRAYDVGGTEYLGLGRQSGSATTPLITLREDDTVYPTADNAVRLGYSTQRYKSVDAYSYEAGGNVVVDKQGGIHHQRVTSTELGDATHIVNTEDKDEGKEVWVTDTNKSYISLGSGATSIWADQEGTANITPV